MSVYGGGHGVTGSAVVDAGVCIDMRGMKAIAVDAGARRTARRGRRARGASSTPPPRSTASPSPAGACPSTGRRRARARQRERLARAQVRLHLRQPARGRGGHRRRPGGAWRPPPRTPTCSGACAAAAATSGSSPAFTFRLHQLGAARARRAAHLAGRRRPATLVRFWRDCIADAPDEVGSAHRVHHRAPRRLRARAGAGPPDRRASSCCYVGPSRRRREGACSRCATSGPRLDLLEPMPYIALQEPHRGGQPARTAELVDGRLPRRAPRRGGRHAASSTPPSRCRRSRRCCSLPGGGAIARVPEDATAFGAAPRAVQHALPLDVGGPRGRPRPTSRTPARSRRR